MWSQNMPHQCLVLVLQGKQKKEKIKLKMLFQNLFEHVSHFYCKLVYLQLKDTLLVLGFWRVDVFAFRAIDLHGSRPRCVRLPYGQTPLFTAVNSWAHAEVIVPILLYLKIAL